MKDNADTKFGSLSWVEVIPDSSRAALPSSRSGHSVVIFEGNLYLFGGQDVYSASNEFWQFHTTAQVWTRLTCSGPPPPRLFNHGAVLSNRKIFVFGGSLGASFSLWVFDFDVYEWECYKSREGWPPNGHSHSVVLYNNTVYMYGGYTYLGNESKELWAYETEDNTWRQIEVRDGPPAMFGHSATLHGPMMWVYGGSSSREILGSLWTFDTEIIKWRHVTKPVSPPPLYHHIALGTGDVMLIYGGLDSDVCPYTGMWRFNFETEAWTHMVSSELPAMSGHAVAVSSSKPASNPDKQNSGLIVNGERCTMIDNNLLEPETTISTDYSLLSNHPRETCDTHPRDNGRSVTMATPDNRAEQLTASLARLDTRSSDTGYVSQSLYPPGDIELRPFTTQSTESGKSAYSLPGMVEDDNSNNYTSTTHSNHTNNTNVDTRQTSTEESWGEQKDWDLDSPPPARIYQSVYENFNASKKLASKPGFCVNNPLYNDTQTVKDMSRGKPKSITFYDNEVIGDGKHSEHNSDSGSQGSRSSLRKKKNFYKRGHSTEFYIAGHGPGPLPTSILLYRCRID